MQPLGTLRFQLPNHPQGVVVLAGGEKKDGTEGISGIVKRGGGNLYSGHSATGGKGGKSRPGMLPTSGNVGAKSFLLAWTFPTLQSDKAMKKAKKNKRVVAI